MNRTRQRRNPDQGQLLMPVSEWVPPQELPDLRGHPLVALDTETNDRGIRDGLGAGWATGGGNLAGISVAVDGYSCYVPVQHPDTACFEKDCVARWLEDLFRSPSHIIMHQASYDCGWIKTDLGIEAPDRMEDTLAMAVMVDENRYSYKLDTLSRAAGLPGKDTRLLKEVVCCLGYNPKDYGEHLWRLPARYVGPYAEQDAIDTLGLYKLFLPHLEEQGLTEAYRLEIDLIPLTMEMRRRGIRIDLELAHRKQAEFLARRDSLLLVMSDRLSHTITMETIGSSAKLEPIFAKFKIPVPRTEPTKGHAEGQASFKKEWMQDYDHWLPKMVVKIDQLTEAADKFLGNYIIKFTGADGRIHANINQFLSEEGGTRSFRFSYSEPPLQQMPGSKLAALGGEFGKEIVQACRGCFLPEPGEEWISTDYKQQEYKLAVHFAAMMTTCSNQFIANQSWWHEAREVVQLFIDKPDTDFHEMVAEWTGLIRRQAKDVNFAIIYGAGLFKFCLMTGLSEEAAKPILRKYDLKLPFMRKIAKFVNEAANERGFIILLDGARCHFNLWEPKGYGHWDGLPLEQATEKWGPDLQRAGAHKAFNRLIQGSAARQTKKAMRIMWQEKIVPMLQMHDELCASGNKERANRIAEIMCEAVPLLMPMLVDTGIGANWGEAKG